MADLSAPVHKNVAGLSFNFFSGIRRWPVRNHLNLVTFFARSDSLVFFIVSRRHFAVARRATIQFHYVLFAEIDILLTVPAIAHRFFEQLAKGFFKIR